MESWSFVRPSWTRVVASWTSARKLYKIVRFAGIVPKLCGKCGPMGAARSKMRFAVFFANYGPWFLMAPFDPSFPPQWDYFDGWLAVFDLEAKIGGAISAFCIATVRDGEGFFFAPHTHLFLIFFSLVSRGVEKRHCPRNGNTGHRSEAVCAAAETLCGGQRRGRRDAVGSRARCGACRAATPPPPCQGLWPPQEPQGCQGEATRAVGQGPSWRGGVR